MAWIHPANPSFEAVQPVLGAARVGLAGHAAFELYSVLTRLPAPVRLSPASATRLIGTSFPATVALSPQASASLLGELAAAAVSGGSVYDALVAAAAREHRSPLVTCDRRAVGTYAALGVDVILV